MNACRTFDARVRAAARAATPIDRLLLLAEDLAVAILSPGSGRFPKGNLTADERRRRAIPGFYAQAGPRVVA